MSASDLKRVEAAIAELMAGIQSIQNVIDVVSPDNMSQPTKESTSRDISRVATKLEQLGSQLSELKAKQQKILDAIVEDKRNSEKNASLAEGMLKAAESLKATDESRRKAVEQRMQDAESKIQTAAAEQARAESEREQLRKQEEDFATRVRQWDERVLEQNAVLAEQRQKLGEEQGKVAEQKRALEESLLDRENVQSAEQKLFGQLHEASKVIGSTMTAVNSMSKNLSGTHARIGEFREVSAGISAVSGSTKDLTNEIARTLFSAMGAREDVENISSKLAPEQLIPTSPGRPRKRNKSLDADTRLGGQVLRSISPLPLRTPRRSEASLSTLDLLLPRISTPTTALSAPSISGATSTGLSPFSSSPLLSSSLQGRDQTSTGGGAPAAAGALNFIADSPLSAINTSSDAIQALWTRLRFSTNRKQEDSDKLQNYFRNAESKPLERQRPEGALNWIAEKDDPLCLYERMQKRRGVFKDDDQGEKKCERCQREDNLCVGVSTPSDAPEKWMLVKRKEKDEEQSGEQS